ncbi:4-hydroxy-tetrahydrodipicolinate reductase [Candidatus Oleimmundimicrobium sp.]|uniref:4-hydroxy-tetrahydrodipicolinate reductase n=1 Tax=Candidatus Oleimmundimicrobium sp. TaxID=3060597 RepID=UPI00271D26AF|nr:4-hydroxy-tetrahydrodipicolinate reductase [Candidatus Oleimmundimicrobium sp.]MDO8885440.1 4-hydroxy-tetrahydrodipicolinate reductase [Candidatus Oleimmundimicrobium sp.]
MIKVVVSGAAGKMGLEVCKAVCEDSELSLVGAVDVSCVGRDVGELIGHNKLNIFIENDLDTVLRNLSPQVVVDFTNPNVVMDNIRTAVNCGVNSVIGTTGIGTDNLKEIESLIANKNVNVFIAPNFAIGAVLMMKFSEIASKYFQNVEIIELHHDKKIDAPSGTAIKTAEMISVSQKKDAPDLVEKEVLKGARGGVFDNIHIHSVRLPGLVAHQEVIFGSKGQTLTIRHDSIERTSFMPGVLLAVKRVQKHKGLTYGLDKITDL